MLIPFESIHDKARVWIYQADRKLMEAEKVTISNALTAFTNSWVVHGEPIRTSFDMFYDHFIFLAAEDPTSGCSIDSSVRVMKELSSQLHIDFFNRTLVAFRTHEHITLIPLPKLKEAYLANLWNKDTETFNNLIETKSAMQSQWIIAAKETWLKRYVPEEAMAN